MQPFLAVSSRLHRDHLDSTDSSFSRSVLSRPSLLRSLMSALDFCSLAVSPPSLLLLRSAQTDSDASGAPLSNLYHFIYVADIPTSRSGERGSCLRSTWIHGCWARVEATSQQPRRLSSTPPPTPGNGQSMRDCLAVRDRVRSPRDTGECPCFAPFPVSSLASPLQTAVTAPPPAVVWHDLNMREERAVLSGTLLAVTVTVALSISSRPSVIADVAVA